MAPIPPLELESMRSVLRNISNSTLDTGAIDYLNTPSSDCHVQNRARVLDKAER